MVSTRKYKIKYGILRPNLISDRVLVLNPAYGEGIGKYGSREVKPPRCWYNILQERNQFYTKLEESLMEEGMRNPIFCNSIAEGTFCRYGTSRLWIAKKKGLDVLTIIADHVDRWKDLEELHGSSDIEAKYKDVPEVIELNEDEMRIDTCPQTHLLQGDRE